MIALLDLLVLAEDPGLAEHLVHQRRLAVIDVRDDGDIANRHGSIGNVRRSADGSG